MQLTLSLYMVAYAIGQVVYGPLSDRYGRLPVMRVALLIYCAASLACALAPNIEMLLAARVLQALGSSGAIVLARAIVRDLYSGARAGRELSLMGAIMALAPVFAPMIGGLLQSAFGWRSHFVLQIAFGLIAATFVWRKLPETLKGPNRLDLAARDPCRLRRHCAQPRGAGLYRHARGELCRRVRLDFGLVFRLAGHLRPFGLVVRAGVRGGSGGYLAGTTVATRIVLRLGLDRTIGVGAVILAAGGLVRSRRSRWAARHRSR